MTALLALQLVHVAAGATFVGGQVLVLAAVWPAALGLPAPEAARVLGAVGPRVGPVMGGSALLALVAGVLRATAWGPIRAPSDLGSAYGLTALAAVALTLASMAHGARSGPALSAAAFDRSGPTLAWAPGARGRVVRSGAVTLALSLGLVAAMVRLRFG